MNMPLSRVVRNLDRAPGTQPTVEIAGFKIEDGIPLPTAAWTRGDKVKQVMERLEVGQSFLIPNLKSAATIYTVKKSIVGKDFMTRKTDGGVRVWRTA
jgi:hypothetical protein